MSKHDMPEVADIIIKSVDYKLDDPMFKSVKDKVLQMLPAPDVKLTFNLLNVNPYIANAIRVVPCTELPVKSLWFKVKHIITDDKTVMLEALRDRISQIPINQDIPMDAEFSLNFVNDNMDAPRTVVKSDSIKHVKGKNIDGKLFEPHHRLWPILAGACLRIPKIRVRQGIGRTAARFCLTLDFKFYNTDYTFIDMLNSKGNIVKITVNTQELMKVMKGDHFVKKGFRGIYKPKILYIPNPDYMSLATQITKHSIRKFPVVIEDVELPTYSSSCVTPKNYWIEFVFKSVIDPKQIMHRACDNIIQRLQRMHDMENVTMQAYENVTEFILKGEMDTIGRMVEYQMFELEPELGFITLNKIHPKTEIIKIKVISVNAEKLFKDALSTLMKKIQIIKDAF
jgi:DNA-directed RNA polymerase subunit L